MKEYFDDWLDNHAKTNLRPSTYSSYTNLTRHYITPYLGNIKLRDLSPVTLDKLFQRFLDEGLKPGTVLIIKRLLSVALEHARKYRYVDINAAKDTLTKLSPTKDSAPPFDIEQTKVLLESVSNTVWEMPVMLGSLYGLRRSEIVGMRWQNVDMENNTFMVVEQLPFKLPKGTTTIDEMAPTKSRASMRQLPITDLARPFFEKQLEIQNCQKQFAQQHNLEYYDNGLLIAKTRWYTFIGRLDFSTPIVYTAMGVFFCKIKTSCKCKRLILLFSFIQFSANDTPENRYCGNVE